MKFSALSVDFIAASSDPLGLRRAAHAGIKKECPLKMVILPLLACVA